MPERRIGHVHNAQQRLQEDLTVRYILATDPGTPIPASSAGRVPGVPDGWLTFGLDRVPALQYAPFAGIPLWQYIASLLFVVIAFYVAKLTDHLILSRVRKWAEKTTSKIDDLLIDLVRGPVKIVVFSDPSSFAR